jgi:hypothetical protein
MRWLALLGVNAALTFLAGHRLPAHRIKADDRGCCRGLRAMLASRR